MQMSMQTNAISQSRVEENHFSPPILNLQANEGKLIPLFISGLLVRVLIPAFFLHILLVKGFAWEGLTYCVAFIPLLGLSSWFFYRKIKTQHQQQKYLSINISDKVLSFSWKGKPIEEILLTEIQVEELGWGPDVHSLLPAIRLRGEGIAPLTIGTMEASAYWADYRRSVECVDFLVGDEKSWNQLMAWMRK
jgi:hypothetical protein